MKISYLLLKPYLTRVEREFQDLEHQLNFHRSEETDKLILFVDHEKKELERLKQSLASFDHTTEPVVPHDLYDQFRRLKLELRFAIRRWKRLNSNEARTKKTQEKRSHVSTFAA